MADAAFLSVDVHVPLRDFTLAFRHDFTAMATGIHGPSGAGKSTLLEVLAGLRRPARGRVVFQGEVWTDTGARRCVPPEHRSVGLVPQGGLLFPHLSAEKNIRYGSARAAAAGDDVAKRFAQVVEVLELRPLLRARPGELSGGERQRVATARALLSGAGLLVLDEPTSALDANLRRRLLPLLARIPDELGVPLLLVSHESSDHLALCGELVALDRGEIVDRGEPASVLERWLGPDVHPLRSPTRRPTTDRAAPWIEVAP